MFFGQATTKTLSAISGAEAQQEKPVSCLEPRQGEHRQVRLAGRPRSRRGQCAATRGRLGARDAGMNLASWACRVPPPARGPQHPWLLPHREFPLWPQNGCSGLCSLLLRSPAEREGQKVSFVSWKDGRRREESCAERQYLLTRHFDGWLRALAA